MTDLVIFTEFTVVCLLHTSGEDGQQHHAGE
jgi:hypothetical protein